MQPSRLLRWLLPGLLGSCASGPVSPPVMVLAPPAIVIDVGQAPPTLPPLSPGFETRSLHGQLDAQPWVVRAGEDVVDGAMSGVRLVPLREGGARGHWIVSGRLTPVDGDPVDVEVVIDTAADRTLVAPELARRLGMSLRPSAPLTDASGTTVPAQTGRLPDLQVADALFRGLDVVVPERALRPGLFLLGRDALVHVDLLVDGVAGGLSILPVGTPLDVLGADDQTANVVALDVVDDVEGGRWQVVGTAPGREGLVSFILDVDTGAPLSSVPAAVGVNGGLPADVGRLATLKGAAGVGVVRRGRFALRPLALGLLTVGSVNALETGTDRGLLGTDVLARSRVLLSPARRALVFLPAIARTGPRVDDGGHTILEVDVLTDGKVIVDAAWPGQRFLLRSHDPYTGAWRGGAVDVVVASAGRHTIETGLTFGLGAWSIRVVPRTSAPCFDTCVSLLGDWPDQPRD